ncbi:8322_t:CDS:2, partial [Acaulospora morrowiae]
HVDSKNYESDSKSRSNRGTKSQELSKSYQLMINFQIRGNYRILACHPKIQTRKKGQISSITCVMRSTRNLLQLAYMKLNNEVREHIPENTTHAIVRK